MDEQREQDAQWFRAQRQEMGLTATQMAYHLGRTGQWVYLVESGKAPVSKMLRLAVELLRERLPDKAPRS